VSAGLWVPTARGLKVPGGGYDAYLRQPPTRRASTVTARRLYPWSVGGGVPAIGVPIGPIIGERGGATLCCDPFSWYKTVHDQLGYRIITNPSVFVLGLPAFGKSTLMKRWIAVLAAWGVKTMILGDVKGEYVALIRALFGDVIDLGPGRGYLNLLDLGSAPAAAFTLGPETSLGRSVMADAKRRRELALLGFIAVLRGAPATDTEEHILGVALRLLDDAFKGAGTPLPTDLAAVFRAAPDALKDAAKSRGSDVRYWDAVDRLEQNIDALADGTGIGEVFSRHTSTPMRTDRSVVFNMSGIQRSDAKMRAAVQVACWAYGFGQISIAQTLADTGHGPDPVDPYRPEFFMSVLDELWDALRTAHGLAGLVDTLGRLNRNDGLTDCKISHTMADSDGLDEKDKAIAAGMVERSGMVATLALPPSEHARLRTVSRWSDRELEMVSSWVTPPMLDAPAGTVAGGVGKVLFKVHDRPGIPSQLRLAPSEVLHTETSQRWLKRAAPAPVVRRGRHAEAGA
jgi:hypothetical protein